MTELSANTHPFKFAREVACAGGALVTGNHLRNILSPAKDTDPQVVKKAKSHLIKAVRDSYEKAGKTCPSEISTLFTAQSSCGYVLSGKAFVRM